MTNAITSPNFCIVPLPQLVASAGAGGAMLTITLLHATSLRLELGHVLVVHDPLGLTGERILAHVYRDSAQRAGSGLALTPPSHSLRWLLVRPPMSRVWDCVDMLPGRLWRRAGERTKGTHASPSTNTHEGAFPALLKPHPQRASHVFERLRERSPEPEGPAPAVLLMSESERPDALTPLSTARLLARALRRQSIVLATTRAGPRASDSALRSGNPSLHYWRTHVVCEAGVLRPVTRC